MATINIVRTKVNNQAIHGGSMPVPDSAHENTETKTSSASNQVSTDAAVESTEFWVITVTGGNIWVQFAAAPVAAVNSDWLILDGQTREFSCVVGDKVGMIDG